ncbi:hypothetical protein N9772_07115 [Bacteroidia bacterium]|jgi:hypothetical protein|nr:hypothetical protein [Bacteroidia bacterium]
MVEVMFTGYSNSKELIKTIRSKVDHSFLQYYPDVDIETVFNTEQEEFEFIYKGEWSSPEDIDEDLIKDICHSNELYCHISIDNKINKSYWYDEDDEFVYK